MTQPRNELPTTVIANATSTEPALKIGASTTAIVGGIYLILDYFFPSIPDNVLQGIMSIAAIVLPLVVAVVTRSKVWSPNSVQNVVDDSVDKALQTATMLNDNHLKLITTDEVKKVEPEI
jgi:hypothetical protein